MFLQLHFAVFRGSSRARREFIDVSGLKSIDRIDGFHPLWVAFFAPARRRSRGDRVVVFFARASRGGFKPTRARWRRWRRRRGARRTR